jgi:nitrogen regulatory protein PII 2
MSYMPKRMLSWLVPDHAVAALVTAILDINQSGHHGDGKVFVCPVESSVERLSEVPTASAALA